MYCILLLISQLIWMLIGILNSILITYQYHETSSVIYWYNIGLLSEQPMEALINLYQVSWKLSDMQMWWYLPHNFSRLLVVVSCWSAVDRSLTRLVANTDRISDLEHHLSNNVAVLHHSMAIGVWILAKLLSEMATCRGCKKISTFSHTILI